MSASPARINAVAALNNWEVFKAIAFLREGDTPTVWAEHLNRIFQDLAAKLVELGEDDDEELVFSKLACGLLLEIDLKKDTHTAGQIQSWFINNFTQRHPHIY